MNPNKRATIKEIEERIRLIDNIDFSNISIEEIKDLLVIVISGYRHLSPQLAPGTTVYRGINYESKPDTLSMLSYPPEFISRIGRANRDGYPVFYCASQFNVPFYEIGANIGDRLVVSEWRSHVVFDLASIGYTDDIFKNLKSDRPSEIKYTLPTPRPFPFDLDAYTELPYKFDLGQIAEYVENEENKLVTQFLARTFCTPIPELKSHLYKLTNAIAEIFLSMSFENISSGFIGLRYPTIKMSANADNFAINKEAIDAQLLKFERATFLEVIRKVGNDYQYKIIDISESERNGRLIWKNLQNSWVTDTANELYFVEDDSGISAYDGNNQLVLPT